MPDEFSGIEIKLQWNPADIDKQVEELIKYVKQKHTVSLDVNLSKETVQNIEKINQQISNVGKNTQASKEQIEQFIAILKTNQSGTIIDYGYNKLGNLQVKIKETNGDLKTLVYQFRQVQDEAGNSLGGEFFNTNEKVKVPLLAKEIESLKNISPEIEKIRTQYEQLNQTFGRKIDFNAQSLIPGLDVISSKLKTTSSGTEILTQKLKLNETQYQEVTGVINRTTGALENVSLATGQLINRQVGMGQAIKIAFTRLIEWQIATEAIFGSIRKLGEAIDYLKIQSDLFTNLQMEMTDTNLNLGQISQTSLKFADSMGTTSDAVLQGISVFGTYTATLDEVLKKSQAAIVLSNITSESMEISASNLMGTIKQFGIAADDAMHVVDVIAGTSRMLQVDFPKGVQEISEGLRTVGSVATEAGLSLEQTSAIIGTLVESTQRSGSEVANSVRTIVSRLQRVTSEVSPEEFTGIEKSFYNIGVAIKSSGDTIRPVNDILTDLADKWKYLSDVEKAEIAQQAAGVYRRNQFIAMMNNWNSIMANTTAAMNSEGVALQKQDIYMQNLTSSLNRLKTAWQNLFNQSMNVGSLKALVDMGSSAINVFAQLSSTFGTLPTIIGLSTLAVALFSTKLREGVLGNFNVLTQFKNLWGGLPTVITRARLEIALISASAKEFGIFPTLLNLMKVGFTGIATSATLAKIAVAGLEAAGTLGLSILLTWLSGKLITAWDNFINREQKAKEAFDELRKSITTLSSETTEAQNLIQQYTELKNSLTQTSEEKQKMAQIQERLAQLFPDTATGINAEGRAYSDNMSLVQQYIKLKQDELNIKQDEMSKKFSTSGNSDFANLQKEQQQYADYVKRRTELQNQLNGIDSNSPKATMLNKQIAEITTQMATLLPQINSNALGLKDLANGFISTSNSINKLDPSKILTLLYSLQNTNPKNFFAIINGIDQSNFVRVLNDGNKELQDMVKNGASEAELNKKRALIMQQLSTILIKVGMDAKDVKPYLDKVFELPNSEKAKNDIKAIAISMEDVAKSFSDSGEQISVYNDLLNKANEGKRISAKDAMDLIAKNQSLIGALQQEGNQYKINVQAVDLLKLAKIDEMKAGLTSEQQLVIASAEGLRVRLKNMGVELEAIKTITQARINASRLAESEYPDMQTRASSYQKYASILEPYANIQKLIDMVSTKGFGVDTKETKGSKGTGTSSFEKYTEKFVSALDEIKQKYQETSYGLSLQISSKAIQGLDILKEKLKLSQQYFDDLVKAGVDLNKQLKDTNIKLDDAEKRLKTSNNADEKKQLTSDIAELQKTKAKLNQDLIDLPKLRDNQSKWLALQKNTLQPIIDGIEKVKQDSQSVVDKIKGIKDTFDDTIKGLQLEQTVGSLIPKSALEQAKFSLDQLNSYKDALFKEIKDIYAEQDEYNKLAEQKGKLLNLIKNLESKKGILTKEEVDALNKAKADLPNVAQKMNEYGASIQNAKEKSEEFKQVWQQVDFTSNAIKQVEDLGNSIDSLKKSLQDLDFNEQFEKQFGDSFDKYKSLFDVKTYANEQEKQVGIIKDTIESRKSDLDGLLSRMKSLQELKFKMNNGELKEQFEQIKDTAEQVADSPEFKNAVNKFSSLWSLNGTSGTPITTSAIDNFVDSLKNKYPQFESVVDEIESKLIKIRDLGDSWINAKNSGVGKTILDNIHNQADATRKEIQDIVNAIGGTNLNSLFKDNTSNLEDIVIDKTTTWESLQEEINKKIRDTNNELTKFPDIASDLNAQLAEANRQLEQTNRLRDVFRNLFGDNLWKQATTEFGANITNLRGQIISTLKDGSDLVDSIFSDIKSKLSDTFVQMLTGDEGFINELLSGTGFEGITNAMSGAFTNVSDEWKTTLTNLGKEANSYFSSGMFTGEIEKGLSSITNIGDIVGNLMENSLNAVPVMVGELITKLPSIFNTLNTNLVQGVSQSVVNSLNEVTKIISSALQVDISQLANITPQVTQQQITNNEVYTAQQPINYTFIVQAGTVVATENDLRTLSRLVYSYIQEDVQGKW